MVGKKNGRRSLDETFKEATYERILAAAGALLVRRGYEATTMSAVAKEVGVSGPALYWHFESKQALIREVIRTTIEGVDARVSRGIPDGDAERQLEFFIENYLQAHLDWRLSSSPDGKLIGFGIVQLLMSLSPEERAELKPIERRTYLRLKEIVAQGSAEGVFDVEDVSLATLTILTYCDYFYTWYRPDGRLTRSAIIRKLTNIAKRIVGLPASV